MSFEERQLWEGIWLEPGGKDNAGAQIVTIRVVDRKSGMLKVGFLNSDYLSYRISDFFIRETGQHIYASTKADKGFAWLRVEVTGHHMLVWLPRAEKFREMVKNGKLPGAVSEGRWPMKVYLEDLTAEHLALIESTEEYFVGPFVLTKVGNRQYSLLDWQDGE